MDAPGTQAPALRWQASGSSPLPFASRSSFMAKTFDAIVVGARCAGSPTAMLLARKGYRVLLIDRATFPSDTNSTHILHPPAIAALARWGLLDRVVATGCPPVDTYAFDFGPLTISGSPGTPKFPLAYCPRRIVLDKILVDAAAEAGAEVREGFTVDDVLTEDRRVAGIKGHQKGEFNITEKARVVIGADGWHSVIARIVEPERYDEKPPLLAGFYAYWSDLPMHGRYEVYVRPHRGFGALTTNDGLTMVVTGWPSSEFAANKHHLEASYLETIALVPEFAERLRSAKRQTHFSGAIVPNYFRKPYGPGWALVGDAGYIKDPITAQGLSDAFQDAERCTDALDAWLAGHRAFDDALGEYQRARDQHALPMYEFTCELARLEPPPPEMQQLLASIHGKRKAMDAFMRTCAGTTSPAEFFAPDNISALIAA
jgi:2-polyprenyl-6-methoxyphenol hydroxylase-like FAD-dependent oxidoreductase